MLAESHLELTDPRDKKGYVFHETNLRKVLTPALIALFKSFARLTVTGTEFLPSKGPVVLACNHLTNYDVVPMQMAVLPRPIFFMGKAELFQNPLADTIFRGLGGFPVYRGERDTWALRHAAEVLEREQVLGIFPEGSRSKGGSLKLGKSGAARLALEAGCPIVPMSIRGTTKLFKTLPRRAQVIVRVGRAIYPAPDASPLGLTDDIMFAIAALLPPEQSGVYAQRPKGF